MNPDVITQDPESESIRTALIALAYAARDVMIVCAASNPDEFRALSNLGIQLTKSENQFLQSEKVSIYAVKTT